MTEAAGPVPSVQSGQGVARGEAPASVPPAHGIAALALAGLLSVLLLDVAIETFLAGVSIRWVPVAAAIVYAASVAALRRRLTAVGTAWTALFALLAVLAATSWMAGGATNGVVAFGQTTSRLLVLVAATGVVLSFISVARLPAVPLPGKAVIGLLALYALWALCWGIVLRTPYPALLHGEGGWQRLPFWLQGAFLGAIVLVPAGLLAHVMTVRAALRAGRAGGWLRQAVALALVAAIAASGVVVTPLGGVASPAGVPPTAASSHFPAREPLAAFPGGVPRSYEEGQRRLNQLLQVVRNLSGLIDPSTLDLAARAAKNGPEIDANFSFVRDSIRFEPYAGTLRGAHGTLVAASGNALDRTLLLADLLERHDRRTQIVRGTLPPADAQKLLRHFLEQPPAAQAAARVEEVRRVVEQAGEPQIIAAAEHVGTRGSRVRGWVEARAARDAAVLQNAVGKPAGWFTDGASRAILERLASHYWLQVEQDGGWLDLDPSFPDAKPGQRFATLADSFRSSDVPSELVHQVRVSMTAEHSDDDQNRSEQTVLDVTLKTPDVAVEQIRVVNQPVDVRSANDLARARRFRPGIRVGAKDYLGTEYSIDGSSPAGAMPDIGGALFGESPAAAKKLTGLWLEITTTGPGTPNRTERRYLVDLVGRTGRESGTRGPAAGDIPPERLAYMALRVYDILVMPAPYPEHLAQWLACRSALENEELLRLSLDVRYGKAPAPALGTAVAKTKAPVFSDALTALATEVSDYLGRQSGGTRLAQQAPFVAMFVQGFDPRSVLKEPVGQARIRHGFDIVATGAVPVGGTPEHRAESGLGYGAFLTALELALGAEASPSGSFPVDNTSAAMEATAAAGGRLKLVRTAAEAAGASESPDVRAAMEADLKGGHVLLVVDAKSGGQPARWWRLDRETGTCLGVNERAEGQALTEEQTIYVNLSIAFVSSLWCMVKVDKKFEEGEISEAGRNFGMAVCAVGFGAGIFAAFTSSLMAAIVGLAVGMAGDICNTN